MKAFHRLGQNGNLVGISPRQKAIEMTSPDNAYRGDICGNRHMQPRGIHTYEKITSHNRFRQFSERHLSCHVQNFNIAIQCFYRVGNLVCQDSVHGAAKNYVDQLIP